MKDLASRLLSLGTVLGNISLMGPQPAEGEVWEQVAGQFLLRACPPGNQLKNTDLNAQRCEPCGVTTYIAHQQYARVKCPRGAMCPDERQFLSKVRGSAWD